MAQSSNANGFRQRAERLGYRQIVIEKIPTSGSAETWYYVSVKEPLAGHVFDFICSDSRLKILLGGEKKDEKYVETI